MLDVQARKSKDRISFIRTRIADMLCTVTLPEDQGLAFIEFLGGFESDLIYCVREHERSLIIDYRLGSL